MSFTVVVKRPTASSSSCCVEGAETTARVVKLPRRSSSPPPCRRSDFHDDSRIPLLGRRRRAGGRRVRGRRLRRSRSRAATRRSVGFNDPTPVAPVGGNPGTTLGQQRFNVYQLRRRHLGGRRSTSNVTDHRQRGLGSAGLHADERRARQRRRLEHLARLPGRRARHLVPAGARQQARRREPAAGNPDDGSGYGNVDIKTQFNVNLGNPAASTARRSTSAWTATPARKVNFVETLLHELGHGLGFSVLTVQTSTGYRLNADGIGLRRRTAACPASGKASCTTTRRARRG